MIPISVVALIDRHQQEETLKSTREWFLDTLKSNLVLDGYLLYSDSFYRLLEDEVYLRDVFRQLNNDENLSYAEVVLACAEYLHGTYTNPVSIKENIFNLDNYLIFIHYLQWSWFRNWLNNADLLRSLKEHIFKRTPTLRFTFSYTPKITRHKIVVMREAGFLEWYLSNFFIGHPSRYCDLELFVTYASSHYELSSLLAYAQAPNYSKLSEPGAIYEAIENKRIEQLNEYPLSEEGSLHLMQGIVQTLTMFSFPRDLVRSLIEMTLRRNPSFPLATYAQFVLKQVTTLQDYTVEDFSPMERLFLLRFLILSLPQTIISFDKDALRRLKGTLQSLAFSLPRGTEVRRIYNSIARLLLERFVDYLLALPETELMEFFDDGLERWFMHLLEMDIFVLSTVQEILLRDDRPNRLYNIATNIAKVITSTPVGEVSPEELREWQLFFSTH